MFYSRKSPRIPGFDCASSNYYFITICTHNKMCIFGQPKKLNRFGIIVDKYIQKIESIFPNVHVDNYIVMPNHIHLILANSGNTNINLVVGQFKAAVTRTIRNICAEVKVWQRSYHDHVIRNQKQYEKIWTYITYNDQKWQEDCFYKEN